MKEHKKLYKAGKLWVTATLFAFAGVVLAASPAAADDTVNAAPQASAAVTTDNGQAATANTEQQVLTPVVNQTNYSTAISENKVAVKGTYTVTINTSDGNYNTNFSGDNNKYLDPANYKVMLGDGNYYQLQTGDLGLFKPYSQTQVTNLTNAGAGSYSVNLTKRGIDHLNALNPNYTYQFNMFRGADITIDQSVVDNDPYKISYKIKGNDFDYFGRLAKELAAPADYYTIELSTGAKYKLQAGDVGIFEMGMDQQIIDPQPGSTNYVINLTRAGIDHLNALDPNYTYSFDSFSGLNITFQNDQQVPVKTVFVKGNGTKILTVTNKSNLHFYLYNGLPIPLNSDELAVEICNGTDVIDTYHPVSGDLQYIDTVTKQPVDADQVGESEPQYRWNLYSISLTQQGRDNIKRAFSYVKGFSNSDWTQLANVQVWKAADDKKQYYLESKNGNNAGTTSSINPSDYVLHYDGDENYNLLTLQPGDLAFYDQNGNEVSPTQPGTYYVNLSSAGLNRLNLLREGVYYYVFQKSTGIPYALTVYAQTSIKGPSASKINGLSDSAFQVTVAVPNQTAITYTPKGGDLEFVSANGEVFTNPQAAGTFNVRLTAQGESSINQLLPAGYKVNLGATTTVNLYQPYVPTAEDYRQNFGSLDGHSIRQVSDSEAALHVAGWHASGASAVMPNGWLIVFDNTLGHEIKRVQIKPVNRPDVQAAYQNVYGSLQSGFDQDILIPLANAGDDLTIIARYSSDAVSGEGRRIDHWFDRMNVDHGNHAYVDSVQFSNGQLHVAGWHATNAALGKPYHSIIAWDATQGRELERVNNVTANRPDIPRAYPTIVMADHSGFSADLKLLPEMANDQIQFISRYSTDEAGNQDYVDYWFGPQQLLADHRNQAYLDNINVQNGKLHIAGQHVTNQSIGRPYHSIIVLNANTGRELGRYTSSQPVSRPDLTRVFPGVITAAQNGFSGDIALTVGMGDQPIRIISRWSATADANSNYVDYWFAPQQLYPDLSNRAALDGFTAQGAVISAAGWHATTQSLGRGHHYIILFDQTANREVQRREVTDNNNRPDVAQAFPGVYNADHAGFNVQFTVDSSVNGHRLVILSRWTNDPAGNGNAVDYWFGNQPVTPEAPVIPAGGVNSPDNHNVKKAFHIDSIKPVIDEYVDPETKQPKSMKILDVTGWMISNYCANWNYKSLRDQIMMHHDWEHARCEQIIFQVNGQDVDNALMMAEGWNNAMDMERPDVAAAYPDVWNSLNSGFQNGFRMFRDIKPTDECRFVFRYYANGGNWKVYDQMVSPIYHFDASTWEHAEIVKD